MSTLKDEVQAYLKSDRQWFREQRIAHAQLMLAKVRAQQFHPLVKKLNRIAFWRMVLAANGAS